MRLVKQILWQCNKKIIQSNRKSFFNETGIHTIVATAVDPNGNLVEDTIEVEVIPIEMSNAK